MKSIEGHARLLEAEVRTRAYARALRKSVRPGDVVLDLGCGTGVLGLLALRFGAGRVHAVDREPVIRIAQTLARDNGMEDRIRFHACDIRKLSLPEKVDLIVSDFVGADAVSHDLLEIHRAALPFLKPGGRVVPREVRILLAPVSAPAEHGRRIRFDGWAAEGIRMGTIRALASQRPLPTFRIRRLTAPVTAARFRLDDRRLSIRPVEFDASFRVSGRMHGVALWVRIDYAPGVSLDSWRGTHLLPLLYPIPEEVRMNREPVSVHFTFHRGGGATWRVRTPRHEFIQDTELGSDGAAISASLEAVPEPPEELRTFLPALKLMDGRRSLSDIARRLRLPSEHALGLVRRACLDFKVPCHEKSV